MAGSYERDPRTLVPPAMPARMTSKRMYAGFCLHQRQRPQQNAGAVRMLCCAESERCTGTGGIATYCVLARVAGFAKQAVMVLGCLSWLSCVLLVRMWLRWFRERWSAGASDVTNNTIQIAFAE